jgi:hypothetical protein
VFNYRKNVTFPESPLGSCARARDTLKGENPVCVPSALLMFGLAFAGSWQSKAHN